MSGVLVNPYLLTIAGAVDVVGALGQLHFVGLPGDVVIPSSIVLRGEAGAFPTNNTPVDVTLPGGTIAGDLCVCVALTDLTYTALPSGFTAVDFNNANVQAEIRATKKVLVSGDITAGKVTVPGDPNFNGIPYQLWFIGGHNDIDVVVTFQGSDANTDAVMTIPGLTTTVPGDLVLVAVGGRDSGDSWTALPGGNTTDQNSAGGYYSMYAGHFTKPAAGAISAQTATNVNTVSTQYVSCMISVKPGSGSAGPVDAIGAVGSYHMTGISGTVDIPGGGGGGGSVTLLGENEAFPTTNATVNVPLPSGTAVGDLCVVGCIGDVGATAAPTGFFSPGVIADNLVTEGRASTKVLDATDIGNGFVTLPGDPNFNGIRYQVWFCGTQSGGGDADFGSGTDGTGVDTAMTVPSVDTVVNNEFVLVVAGCRGSGTSFVTPPGGGLFTDQDHPDGYISMYAGHYSKATAGATGTQVISNVGAAYARWVTLIMTVRPA